MNNLIKNVIRSFAKTKTAIVCLVVLVFLSIGIFSLLNNTTKNFDNSYVSLVKKGNLNDFVVNEKYDYGSMKFDIYYKTKSDNDYTKLEKIENIPQIPPKNISIKIKLNDESKNNIVLLAYEKNETKYNDFFNGVEYLDGEWSKNGDIEEDLSILISNSKISFRNTLSNDPNIRITSFLEEKKLEYKNYSAINITDEKFQKKIITSNPKDEINKLVIYEGENLFESNSDIYAMYHKLFLEIKTNNDKNILNDPLNSEKINDELKKYLIPFYKDLKLSLLEDDENKHEKKIELLDKAINDNGKIGGNPSELWNIFEYGEFKNDGYKFTITVQKKPIDHYVVGITDFSSYETVIAPGNWKYEHNSGKEIYPKSELEKWRQIVKDSTCTQKDIDKYFNNKIDSKYKIKIGSIEYLIIGVGITPDFMYPVYSVDKLVPNPQTERLYYVNTSGYNRTRTSFLTNPVEEVIVGKFNSDSSVLTGLHNNKNENIICELNEWATKFMSWPNNIKSAYFVDDTTNYLNLNAARIAFIPTLIQTISNISLLITTIILGLALFVGVLIIKSYISKNKFSLAVLQANGINKHKIVGSLLLFSIIPSIIGGIIGYILGYTLQSFAIEIFSNYWFISVKLLHFNFVFMIICILLPIIIFCCTTLLIGYLILRQNLVQNLKNDSDFKVSKFALIMKMPFKKFSVITRFRTALAFNSFWKLIILSILSSATMVVLNFSISAANTFDEVKKNTQENFEYEYAIDLITPTEQSGLIKYQLFCELGSTADDLFNGSNSVKHFGNNGWNNIHLVNLNDQTDQSKNILYLKDKTQSKLFLDYPIKTFSSFINPWELTNALMPANQFSASESEYDEFIKQLVKKGDVEFLNKDRTKIDYEKVLNPMINMVLDGVLKKDYIKWLIEVLNRIKKGNYESDYKITYNVIGLEEGVIGNANREIHESPQYSYTRIDVEDDNGKKLNIKGIKNNNYDDENYLGPILKDSNGIIINEKLFSTEVENPIIINRYTAKKYNLKVGSEFKLKVTNKHNRITEKIQNKQNVNVVFNVIDICNSAYNNEIYTSYKSANNILDFLPKDIKDNLPFNGYFTNSLYTFNKSTPLFSTSGLYPGTTSFDSNNIVMKNLIKNTIKDKKNSINYKALQIALGQSGDLSSNNVDDYLTKLNDTYNGLPYETMINYIDNVNANISLFENISNTSLLIQRIVIGIIIPIVLLVVILISNMLIDDLRKIGLRMKALGFSYFKILSYFLSIYVPIFIIGLIISIPVSIGFIIYYNQIIFLFSNIVLITTLMPIAVIFSSLLIILLFAFSFVINWVSLKKLNISQEMKNF